MTKNPFLNALGATGYIVLITSLMNFLGNTQQNKPDTPYTPVVFLSLLTLSAAVMAYLFFYQPLQLLLDGKKKEALRLFTQTIGIFAVFTAIGLVLLLSGLI